MTARQIGMALPSRPVACQGSTDGWLLGICLWPRCRLAHQGCHDSVGLILSRAKEGLFIVIRGDHGLLLVRALTFRINLLSQRFAILWASNNSRHRSDASAIVAP
jgi:hypothetical protein